MFTALSFRTRPFTRAPQQEPLSYRIVAVAEGLLCFPARSIYRGLGWFLWQAHRLGP
ncbi:hypothetical protein ARTHRO9V_20125 [Arthrobacter sp. 9V]|nr:hypothetical protein ARTHRO9V_20125 [Arthrobacter sp. 9V]